MTSEVHEIIADLTELRLTQDERKEDPILEKWHHIQCDQMVFRRLDKIKRLLMSQRAEHVSIPCCSMDVHSKCEQKFDLGQRVVDELIEQSEQNDGIPAATKRQKRFRGGSHLTGWELMALEARRRGWKPAVPPQKEKYSAGTYVEGKNVHPPKIRPCDEACSSAGAGYKSENKSDKTCVGSRASFRSSTRMTPSKLRKNLRRAQQHNPAGKKRPTEPEPEDLDSGDSTDRSGPEEMGPPQAQSERSTGFLSLLEAMQAIPAETREQALSRMKEILVQFLPPPNITVGGESDGTVKVAGEAEAADPSAPIFLSPALVPSGVPSDGTQSVAGGASVAVPSPFILQPLTSLPSVAPSDGTVCMAKGGLATRPAQPYASLGADLPDASLTLRRPVPPPPPPAPPAAAALFSQPSPVVQRTNPWYSEEQLLVFERRTDAQLAFFGICSLCAKQRCGWHEQSGGHKTKLREHAMLDYMLGPTSAPRMLTPQDNKAVVTGVGRPLSRSLIREIWGSTPENLVEFAKMKWKDVGVRVNGKTWPYVEQMNLELAFTTFKRGGKYSEGDHCVPWSAIPNGASTEYPGPSAEVENPGILEQMTGWWPVVCASDGPLTPSSTSPSGGPLAPSDGPSSTRPLASSSTRATTTIVQTVVTVCVYQWMWDQPVGWYTVITRTRSRL